MKPTQSKTKTRTKARKKASLRRDALIRPIFPVAIIMTRHDGKTLNISSGLNHYAANSEDEAVGAALREAQIKFPDHTFNHYVAQRVPNSGGLPRA